MTGDTVSGMFGTATPRLRPALTWLLAALLLLAGSGCSGVKKVSVNALAKSLSGAGGNVFTADEDPELVRDALPFALKTFESLLEISPDNVDLLLTTCQGFVLYGYAFVELDAKFIELDDYRAAERLRDRALKLYLRGRGYCFRALDKVYPGTSEALVRDAATALDGTRAKDVRLLYWNAMSWGAVIAAALDRPELVVDLPAVRALLERCLELAPDFEQGAVHEAMMALEALPEHMGGSTQRAREHYERAVELNGGRQAGTHVSWAALVALPQQDRAAFESHLHKALAVDPNLEPSQRLSNILQQRRARFLLDQVDDLFFEDIEEPEQR